LWDPRPGAHSGQQYCLNELSVNYGSKGLVVLATAPAFTSFPRGEKEYPHLYDKMVIRYQELYPGTKFWEPYEVEQSHSSKPVVYLIDKEGVIRQVYHESLCLSLAEKDIAGMLGIKPAIERKR